MSPLDQACTLLADLLNDGPRASREILAAAEGANISERTMQRAAEQMGVIKSKAGFDGGWHWALPSEGAKAEPATSRAAIIAARLRKLEVNRGHKGPFYPQDSRIQAWARSGISDPDLKEAYERATTEHRGMLTAGILDGYVSQVMAKAMA